MDKHEGRFEEKKKEENKLVAEWINGICEKLDADKITTQFEELYSIKSVAQIDVEKFNANVKENEPCDIDNLRKIFEDEALFFDYENACNLLLECKTNVQGILTQKEQILKKYDVKIDTNVDLLKAELLSKFLDHMRLNINELKKFIELINDSCDKTCNRVNNKSPFKKTDAPANTLFVNPVGSKDVSHDAMNNNLQKKPSDLNHSTIIISQNNKTNTGIITSNPNTNTSELKGNGTKTNSGITDINEKKIQFLMPKICLLMRRMKKNQGPKQMKKMVQRKMETILQMTILIRMKVQSKTILHLQLKKKTQIL